MEDEINSNRRKVLRNVAAAGSASLIGMTASVGASPTEASVDIDRLLNSDRIKKLQEEIPGLELRSKDARVLGGEQGVVAIPANFGILLTRPPEETDAASFYFNKWVPEVDSDWVEGTQARLRVADDVTVLTRTATDEETKRLLSSIDIEELDPDNTTVSFQPETGKVTFSHVDADDRRYDRVTAELAGGQVATEDNRLATDNVELEVTDRESGNFSDISHRVGAQSQSACDQDDVVFCIIEASSCFPCAFTVVGGPVFAACILVVCLGVPAVPIATAMADIGCTNVGQCTVDGVADIASDLIDEFADQIPI